jgi:IS605 OrfB family transposase
MGKLKTKSVKRVKVVVEALATPMVHPEREDDQESHSELEATPVVVVPTTTKRKRVKKSATLKANNNIMRCVSVPVTLYRPGVDVSVSTSPYSIKSSRPLHQQPEIIEKRSLLNKLFGTYRHIYNATVQLFNDKKIDVFEEYDVRAKLTNVDGELAQPWYSELPTPSKQKAVTECFTQVKTNLAKGGDFKMKFKSKLRSPQQCLPYGNCKVLADERTIILPYELRGKTSPLNEIVLFMKNGVPDAFKSRNDKHFVREEVKVLMSRNGNLHVVIPLTLSQVQEAGSFSDGVKIVALDPGGRAFQTFYTPTGQCGKIGTCSGDDVDGSSGLEKMERLLKKIDKTISTLSKPEVLKSKKRRRLKRQKYRKLDQVKNVRNDFHRKTCVWLLRNFDIVLLPKFEVKDMVTSLNSKTCRAMYTWAHYAFKQRLLEMSQKYTHKKVLIVNEAYTTRTCGNCFVVNNNVGTSKVFECVNCGLEADRDVHAARNILLRYVPDLFVLPDALKC